jgi:hypothetical protein
LAQLPFHAFKLFIPFTGLKDTITQLRQPVLELAETMPPENLAEANKRQSDSESADTPPKRPKTESAISQGSIDDNCDLECPSPHSLIEENATGAQIPHPSNVPPGYNEGSEEAESEVDGYGSGDEVGLEDGSSGEDSEEDIDPWCVKLYFKQRDEGFDQKDMPYRLSGLSEHRGCGCELCDVVARLAIWSVDLVDPGVDLNDEVELEYVSISNLAFGWPNGIIYLRLYTEVSAKETLLSPVPKLILIVRTSDFATR